MCCYFFYMSLAFGFLHGVHLPYKSSSKYYVHDLTGYDFGCQELDFLSEAKNSEKCLDNFKRLSPHLADSVYAPKIHWNLSTSKLLTMEFMDAPEVTNVDEIRRLGIHPKEVSKLVSSMPNNKN